MTPPATNAASAEATLDVDRFDCYQAALQFQELAAHLLVKGAGALRDQLDRASTSVVLNLAEGIGRRARREKAHFYAVARGSALESAAIVDLARRRGLAEIAVCAENRALLVRIVQMLTKLEQRMRR
jgi:four helix bundle protein